jgi:hypothetical protein
MRLTTPLTNAVMLVGLIVAHGLAQVEGANMRSLAGGQDDWTFCMFSWQCKAGCCSKEYSDDGKLKCTPGGSPSKCTNGGGGGGFNPPPVTAPPAPSTGRGDWQFCTASFQCQKSCCSKQYSDDGKLKCTPGGSRDQCV